MSADLLLALAVAFASAGAATLALAASGIGAGVRMRLLQGGGLRALMLSPLARANQRWLGDRLEVVDRWVRKAGRPRELSAAEAIALAQISALLGLVTGAGAAVAIQAGFGAIGAGMVAGALGPALWLRDRARLRHRAISRALPWALDLLTLSVEAGLDFAAAVAKVAEKTASGPLGQELAMLLLEIRLGKTREEALRNLGRRVELGALTSFVRALIHADRMGTPLGKVLRILATQLRVERTQRAEKLANEAPVKLLLPLLLCIFPTLFLMLFGPIAHQLFAEGSF